MVDARRVGKYAGLGVLGLVGLLVLGFLLGFLGVPSVEGVENRFGPVNDSTTVVETDLAMRNPNPMGITLGGTTVNYTVSMNDVTMANGRREGIGLGAGRSTLNFTTYLRNERIPAWWYTHVANGERTELLVDADISVGLLLGHTFNLPQPQTVETDILGSFNDTTTRPIDVGMPLVSDPALFLNATRATYGAGLSPQETPMHVEFDVFNPKSWPYTVTEIGYTIRMNGVEVGSGSTADPYTLPPRTTQTLEATATIQNGKLDDWWVTHLENDQVTNMTIDFYVVIDPEIGDFGRTVEPIRLDVDAFDYETVIETDMFGNKNDTRATPDAGQSDDGGQSGVDGGSTTDDGTASDGRTESTASSGTTVTDESTTAEPVTTAEPTQVPTTTDDGGLLG